MDAASGGSGAGDDAVAPPLARVRTRADLPAALAALGIPSPRPVLVCVGGADGMPAAGAARLARLVTEHVAPVVERLGVVVVDGGTDAGLMRVLGRARAARADRFVLVGVAAAGTVRLTRGDPPAPATGSTDRAALEPHHSGVLLVPGDAWGDESVWIAHAATEIAGPEPSVTLLLDGGEVALADVEQSVAGGRPVLVVSGTGRTADAVAEAVGAARARDHRTAAVAASGLVTVVPVDSLDDLARALDHALTRPRG